MSPRIAFVSPCGWGNLGDAAIIDSLIGGIRRRSPTAEIVGFTLNPADTAARHGIKAFPLGGYSLPRYSVKQTSTKPTDDAERDGKSGGESNGNGQTARALLRRALGVLPGVRRGWQLASLARAERRHRSASAARISGFDLVVVAGGGQLDDFWGGALGHPCTLWRWGALSRKVGARYVMLSVGTGTLRTRASWMFVRRARGLASYRSFRDGRSREILADRGLPADDPVVPDLAYALPLERPLEPPHPARPVVGLSPMAYADPRAWPEEDADRYRRHVASLVELAIRMLRAGHEVVLFATDGSDRTTLAELRAALEPQLGPAERALLRVPVINSVADLMRTLSEVEIVVAARLHGVLLGHVAGRPALAISHERKVATLMKDMGHDRYCFDIDDFDAETGWQRFTELYERRAQIGADLRAKVTDYRARVEAQYDQVFGTP